MKKIKVSEHKKTSKYGRVYRTGAGVLGAVIAVTTIGIAVPVSAAETVSDQEAGKEEVVYCMADAAGKVSDVEVVNIFPGGTILDYGDYSSVKMLTTNDKISQSGDEITFSTDAEKVYYQGTMEDTEIPWNIDITYTLDGKEISSTDLAGQSGALAIHFVITENKKVTTDFYDNYALQASFTLDGDLCKNIVAADGTMANVGNDKQITYTILPGKGIDTTLTADVTDFEMDAVAVNGIRLNLNMEIDDAELMDKVSDLMDATEKLNDGATQMNDGTDTLASGAETLSDGAAALETGAGNLDTGIASLQTGITTMQTGLNTLNSKSATLTAGSAQMLTALETLQTSLNSVSVTADQLQTLTDSSAAIKTGIAGLKTGIDGLQTNLGYAQYQALMSQNGLDVAGLQTGNTAVTAALNIQIASLQGTLSSIQGMPGYETQVAELQTQIGSLQSTVQLLAGYSAAMTGTESYLNAMAQAVSQLETGVTELQTKYEAFDQAIGTLADTLSGLLVNMTALQSGVGEIVTNYRTLNAGISEYTNGVASIVAGYEQMVSGVSALASGSRELLNGASSLSDGSKNLYDGVITLCDGASDLSDGTGELYDQTSDMDTQVQDQIDEILASIQGDDTEMVSFVSEKNTNVKSVQFVIKTEEIKIPDTVSTEKTEVNNKGFWQKLTDLFR